LWQDDSEPPYSRPAYCNNCGRAFPWTTAAVAATKELAIEADLSEMDRNELPDIIENLVRETPRSSVAAARMRRILEKAKPWASEGFKTILIEVVTEGAKKMIWPT